MSQPDLRKLGILGIVPSLVSRIFDLWGGGEPQKKGQGEGGYRRPIMARLHEWKDDILYKSVIKLLTKLSLSA